MQDGYWFFKSVLDRGAVARLRAKYVEFISIGATAIVAHTGDLATVVR
jgi:hypothetical protein